MLQIMEQVQGKLWGENTRKILLRAPDMDSCKGWVSNLQELCPLHLKELDKVNKSLMLARDTAVLRACASRSIPVATVIGGGYDRDRGRLARRHATIFHAARSVWRQFYMR